MSRGLGDVYKRQSVILQNVAYLIWNPTAHPFHADLGLPINIAGITLPMTYLWMLVTGFVVAGALYFFLNKTKMGLGVRAVAFSKDISNLVGINVPLYISIIFGIACALAGIAGTLVGPTYQVVVYMGLYYSSKGICVCSGRWFW